MKTNRTRFDTSGTITMFVSLSVQKPLLEASYQVTYICAKKKTTYDSWRSYKTLCVGNGQDSIRSRSLEKNSTNYIIKRYNTFAYSRYQSRYINASDTRYQR